MTQSRRFVRILVRLAPGSLLFGSSCLSDLRDSLVAGTLDFVEGTATDTLTTLLPISDLLAGLLGAA